MKTAGSFLSTVSLSVPAVTSGACKLLDWHMAYYIYIVDIISFLFSYLTSLALFGLLILTPNLVFFARGLFYIIVTILML